MTTLQLTFRGALSLVAFTASAWAQLPIINVGNHNLLANTPGQQIQLFVSEVPPVVSLDFWIQVADGGTDAGGIVDGPSITSADLITGTLFDVAPYPGTQVDGTGGLQWHYYIVPAPFPAVAPVSGSGLLATVTIDTTGFGLGVWPLRLGVNITEPPTVAQTAFGDNDGELVSANITDGTITIVPEPATGVALASLLLVGAFLARRRGG